MSLLWMGAGLLYEEDCGEFADFVSEGFVLAHVYAWHGGYDYMLPEWTAFDQPFGPVDCTVQPRDLCGWPGWMT